jgi:hypothetical protein
MKTLCLILVLAVSTTGCSRFSKSSQNERAYYKYLKKSDAARGAQRTKLMKRERGEAPSLRPVPPLPPLKKSEPTREEDAQPTP